MIADPLFYAVAVPAVVLVGLSKSGFLPGLGVVGVPMLALAVSPVQAAGILLPILLAMDAAAIWAYRRSFDRDNLKVLLPGCVVGTAVGWLTASFVSDAQVRLLVGAIALAFLLHHMLGKPGRMPAERSGAMGGLAGAVAGFTSFVAHAGSPPYQMYMLPQRLEPRLYAGTFAMFFVASNLLKVVPYAALGQLGAGNLATSAVLAPLAPLAIWAGYRLARFVDPGTFYRLVYALLLLVALKLIWDGARGTLGV